MRIEYGNFIKFYEKTLQIHIKQYMCNVKISTYK